MGLRAALLRRPVDGQRVLIIGSGIVGLSVFQAVRAVTPKAQISIAARYPHQAEAAGGEGGDGGGCARGCGAWSCAPSALLL